MSGTGDAAVDGTALVSGATGFVGGHLVRRLRAEGRRVVAVTRGTSAVAGLAAGGVEVVVDPGDTEGLAAAIAGCRPTTVFHLAAKFVARHVPGDVDDLVVSNLGFATRLAEAAIQSGCRRFVAAGTSWRSAPDGTERPNSLYAATKAAFETILMHYAEADGAKVVALQLYETYGPDDGRRKLLPLLLSALASGERLGLSPGEQRLDFVHVDDVVEAFLVAERRAAANDAGRFERFAVRSGRAVSVRELVAILEAVSGRTMPVGFGERPYRAGEVMAPAPGEILPGWHARVGLEVGLAAQIERRR